MTTAVRRYYTSPEAAWGIAACSALQILCGVTLLALNSVDAKETTTWWVAIMALSIASIVKGILSLLADRHWLTLPLSVFGFILGTLYFGISMSKLFPPIR